MVNVSSALYNLANQGLRLDIFLTLNQCLTIWKLMVERGRRLQLPEQVGSSVTIHPHRGSPENPVISAGKLAEMRGRVIMDTIHVRV